MSYDDYIKLCNKKILKMSDISDINYNILHSKILSNKNPRQIIWHLYTGIIEPLKCLQCDEKYTSWAREKTHHTKERGGYKKYCSSKCSATNEETKDTRKETVISKYGTDNVFKNNEIKEKIKQTNIEKYGVENPRQNDKIKEKIKQTNIEKYGVENPRQNDKIKEKVKKTNIERYGVENPQQNKIIKNKTKQTMLGRYGCEYPIQNNEIKEKIKKTHMERYGCEYPIQNDEIKEKIKNTNLERYGCEVYSKHPDYAFKVKKTNIEKYGSEYYQQTEEFLNRVFETNINKYGTPYNSQKHLSSETIEIINDKNNFCNFIKDKTVYDAALVLKMHSSSLYDIIKKYNAYDLYQKKGPSYLEIEMKEFLDTNNITYEQNNRTILDGKELDFYIPDYNIAIEMNGVYWHSDKFKIDKNYHYDKWKICNDKNIYLVNIFEDDWKLQQDKIYNLLLSIFNKKPKGIPARKSHIQKITGKIARNFLNEYHLQGYVSGTHYGAFDVDNNLIGVMTFGTTRNSRFELKRFVTDNYTHSGLFSKLFKFAQRELNFTEVVSFSDNTCFTGNVYKINGFDFIQVIPPDYRYLFNNKRVHKSNFKKSNIKQKFPELSESIDNGMTESQAMDLLGINKIYDCGKCEWVWKNEKI
jgi:hypothetical protein